MAAKKPSASKSIQIKVCKNGPYLVSGGVPLSEQVICTDADGQCHGWREGKKYEPQENYALCRCGHSGHKPFCDGTHEEIRFDGTETASRQNYRQCATEISGPALKLTDAQHLCTGAGFCQRGEGAWRLTRKSDSRECREAAIEEACECPSGRLVAWEKEGEPVEPPFEPSVGLVQGPGEGDRGPVWVRGGIPIESADGTTYEVRNRVTLCRCGKSKNKPFCDGSHAEE